MTANRLTEADIDELLAWGDEREAVAKLLAGLRADRALLAAERDTSERLRALIALRAATQAYKAGMGATEWRAFLSDEEAAELDA